MKILKINVMRGPNVWSNYRKNLIILRLDLAEFRNITTNELANFTDRLTTLVPSLYTHRCSVGKEGGFFERLCEGTLLGHVIEHLAIELQNLAGMDCGYGRARETKDEGIYNIIFSYVIEKAGIRAAQIAFDIISTLANNKPYLEIARNINELKAIYAAERLGPSTEAILNEAISRNIPVTHINDKLTMLGYGCNQKLISATLNNQTSFIGVDIVGDKSMTKEILASQYIPVPQGVIIHSFDELEETLEQFRFPLVIKPRYGNHGRGVTTNIKTREKAFEAFDVARKVSNSIVVEQFIEGYDYRILVINYKFVAVAKRIPAQIIGDGNKTIEELINEQNTHPHRGEHHENILTSIKIDDTTLSILAEKGLSLDTVLDSQEVLHLKYTANISTGGTAVDLTEEIHPDNIFLAERIARLVNLDVCGIDVIANDITIPIKSQNSAIIEVNAAPGFRMHLSPTIGVARNVAKQFVDMLFPKNKTSARIPIVAVTGTNGKTTVVRLISHVAKLSLKKVGMATTEGLYIGDNLIYSGDCSGPRSATDILRDPLIDFAVLECARGGILRSGLGFDYCTTSIVTNVTEDHLGMDNIDTLEELARVKSVVPQSTIKNGYAILNADDELVYDMKHDLDCEIALFSSTRSNIIIEHCNKGNLACFIENDHIYLCENKELIKISKIDAIPLTANGKLKVMIKNILPALLACWVNHFPLEDIIKGLMSFYPTPETLPGRFNIFNFENCQVMVDYAHNKEAYSYLQDYVSQIDAKKKVGIIAGTGDRRPIDLKKTGSYAAQTFDEIIIRHDQDSRGRTNEEITDFILQGIKEINATATVHIISDEFEALDYAIKNANPGTFISYFPDKVLNAVNFLKDKIG